ncbi:MAG: AAA family ATPase [Gammaproteobacteria bacterium]
MIGTRQVGKTTLAKTIAPHFTYFDLEKPSHYDQITHDPEFFFAQHPEHIILDEAQELPFLFNILRGGGHFLNL